VIYRLASPSLSTSLPSRGGGEHRVVTGRQVNLDAAAPVVLEDTVADGHRVGGDQVSPVAMGYPTIVHATDAGQCDAAKRRHIQAIIPVVAQVHGGQGDVARNRSGYTGKHHNPVPARGDLAAGDAQSGIRPQSHLSIILKDVLTQRAVDGDPPAAPSLSLLR